MLFCFKSRDVTVTLSDEEVTFALRISPEEWGATKAEFIKKKFIDEDNNLLNWEKRQYESDSSAERTRLWRERKKQERDDSETKDETSHVTTGDVTVTPQNRTEQNREEENKEPTGSSAANEKISFDRSTGKFAGLAQAKLELWRNAYPAVHLQTEISKAAVWLQENPKNKKSNYGRFLAAWLGRAQDKAPKTGNDPPRKHKMPSPAGG